MRDFEGLGAGELAAPAVGADVVLGIVLGRKRGDFGRNAGVVGSIAEFLDTPSGAIAGRSCLVT